MNELKEKEAQAIKVLRTFERLMNGGNNLSFMAWGEGWDVWGNEVECTAHLPTEETPCCG